MEQNKTQILNPIQSENPPAIAGIQRIAEFIQFAFWSGTPKRFRQPKTQAEFARSIGVSPDSLTDWKNHTQFWPLAYQATVAWLKEQVPEIIEGLYNKALSKDVSAQDVSLLLQIAGLGINKNNKTNERK